MPNFLMQMPARVMLGAAFTLLGLAAGCNYSHGSEPAPCNDPTPATYTAVVSPIFDAHCRSCPGSGVYQTQGGGNDFSSYQGIKNESTTQLLGCIEQQPGFDPMPKGAAKLSDCDIARIRAWIAAGQLNN